MKDVEIIGMLKAYVKASLVGVGALKGAPCQCVITENADGTHKVTMKWVDDNGVAHTDSFDVLNGQVGGFADISDVSLTNLQNGQVVAYNSTTQKWENVTNSATVNTLNSVGDVTITAVQDGEALVWDDTAGKWVNKDVSVTIDSVLSSTSENPVQNKVLYLALEDKANISDLGTAAAKDSTNAVTQNSEDLVESGAVYTELSGKADKATTLSGYGITDAYTKTETDNAITAEIEKLDFSDSAVAGNYVTAVSEADGKISVTRDAADVTPTANSTKMLTSGGAKTALDAKQDTLTFDNAPTENSDNPVKSSGVYTANQNIYEVMGRNGAKNLIPFDLATIKANNTTGTWNNNVYTLNGVDFTFNADGSVLVDGTASGNAEVDYLLNLSISGDFILSDAVAGVASNYWAFAKVDGDDSNLLILTSDEIPASISSTMDYFRIKVFSGKTASNILFKPMLRLASDTDPTYQPYAKTNQELTSEQGYCTEDQYTAIQTLLS